MLDQFVSRFTNKIDAKGRVSVPASFRAVLARDGHEGIYCYPALDQPALDGGGNRLRAKIGMLLDGLPDYSDEKDMLAAALYGVSEVLKIDRDGRTMLSEELREHAGIKDKVTFVGLGDKFQIWEPARFETHFSQAREKVRELRKLLGAGRPAAIAGQQGETGEARE